MDESVGGGGAEEDEVIGEGVGGETMEITEDMASEVAPGYSNHEIGTQAEWNNETEATQVLDSAITGYSDEQGQVGAGYVTPKGGKGKGAAGTSKTLVGGGRKSSFRVSLPFSTFPSVTYQAGTPSRTNSSVGVTDELEDFEYEEEERRHSLSDKQADAYIMARPIGYRHMKLLPGIKKPMDKETQVSAFELQKAAALLRGIVYDQHNVLWPSNGDFSISKAERKIEEYVTRCWKVCQRWFFHVKYLHCVAGCYRNKYIFEVKWSMPTKEDPIPKATASVYFIFDVEIYGGRDETVKVQYVIEGHRYPHVPGEVPFQQKWISSIICEKIRMQRSVCF